MKIPDRADAEDLTSEVFRRALGGLARFEWRGRPAGAERLELHEGPTGSVAHAKLRIGDSVVEIGEAHRRSSPCRA